MYAAQAAERGGGGVPAHLQDYLPGGSAYDPSRDRETRMGRIVGGASDALGRIGDRVRDSFDGGGRGESGSTFQGGVLSGTLNALGISPYGQGSGRVSGFMDRLGSGGSGPGFALMQGEDTPPQSMFTAAAPVVDPAVDPAVDSTAIAPPPPVPPAFMPPVQPATAVSPDSQFTFEQYLARLNALPQFLSPPPVAPIAPMAQGIGSLPPAGLMG
jgi:hypothetical protein